MAEDSDDEKRMEKAENRAERKLAKKMKIREARMKDDVGAKSAIPPGALRPFPAKGADAMKGAGTSLLSRHRGSQRAHALNVGIPATGGRNALRWLEVVRILFLILSKWWMVEKVLMCCMCHLHLSLG